jgi:hypothetical protein
MDTNTIDMVRTAAFLAPVAVPALLLSLSGLAARVFAVSPREASVAATFTVHGSEYETAATERAASYRATFARFASRAMLLPLGFVSLMSAAHVAPVSPTGPAMHCTVRDLIQGSGTVRTCEVSK